MVGINWKPEWELKKNRMLGAIASVGCLFVVGGVVFYQQSSRRRIEPVPVSKFVEPESISALGRLEPQGETIQVFAPTSNDAARLERLLIAHGQQIRKGDVIAYLDTYERRKAAWEEAKQQVEVAISELDRVEAGAKTGDIRAQREKVGQIQAELTAESASQRAVIARIVAERDTEIAAQKATIARLQAEVKNAALEDRRYQALFIEGAVAETVRDTNRLTWETTQQQLAEAKANLQRIQRSKQEQIQEARENLARILSSREKQITGAKATLNAIAEVRPVDVAAARTRITQAQTSVKRAKAELDLAIVRSPQDGQVLKIHTRPGEMVGSQGIISLGKTERMVAVAEVYELDISRVNIGQIAMVRSKNNAFADILRGEVTEVGLEIGKKDVLNTDPAAQFDARVVEVKVLLDKASSRKVAGLTNLSIQVEIDTKSK